MVIGRFKNELILCIHMEIDAKNSVIISKHTFVYHSVVHAWNHMYLGNWEEPWVQGWPR